jgi:hypothetical protein
MFSLKVKIEMPEIFGKIDLSKIDSSTRPKGITQQQIKRSIQLRDKLDSGWGWTFRQLVKNFKRNKQ